jgi:hypothetical protein
MPPALDRLLASPSALRLLRSIVNGSDIPAACSPSIFCAHTICTRNHSTDRVKQHWRRWKENAKDARSRDRIRELLESDETPIKTGIEEQPAALEDGQDTLLNSTKARKATKSNAERWAGSLYRRERYHGQRGIMEIWNLRRHAQSYLPADNTLHAEYLWGTFIKHPKLVEQVIDHAAELLKETKQTYLRL